MRVRMRVTLSGTRNGVDWPAPGGTIDLPGEEATHMVAAGLAVMDDEQLPVEEATAPVAETSTPSSRRRSQAKGK